MSFKSSALTVLAYAKDFTLWHYRSPDTAVAEGYFDRADDLLASGDMILANLGQGTESRIGIYLVTANAAGAVGFDDLSGAGATQAPPGADTTQAPPGADTTQAPPGAEAAA